MTHQELKTQVDKLWTEFWTGGITNLLMVIEQISFLMFARLLNPQEIMEEKTATIGCTIAFVHNMRLKCKFQWIVPYPILTVLQHKEIIVKSVTI